MKIILTILCLLTSAICLFGQVSDGVLQHFSTKDGLASNTVYTCTQDDRGFLWFATESGISRFDGKEFRNYGIQEGLRSQASYAAEFYKGFIWAISFKGIDVIKDDIVVNRHYPQLNVTKCNDLMYSGEIHHQFFLTTQDSVFLYDSSFKFIAKYAYKDPLVQQKYYPLYLFRKFELYPFRQGELCYGCKKEQDMLRIFYYDTVSQNFLKIAALNIKHPLRGIMIARDDRIYIGTQDGVYVYLITKKAAQYQCIVLKGQVVNTIFEDREHNIWIATDKDGVYLLKSANVRNRFIKLPGANSIARLSKNALVIGCQQSHYLQIESNRSLVKKTLYQSSKLMVWNYDDSSLAVYGKPYLYTLSNPQLFFDYSDLKVFCPYSKDTVLIGCISLGYFFSMKQNRIVDSFFYDRVSALFVSADKTIWIGSYHGLYQYTTDKRLIKYDLKEYSDIIVNAIGEDANHNLWVSTRGAGILSVNLKNRQINQLQQKNGLQSDDNHKIFIDNKNRKWILSSGGVLMIDEQNKYHYLSEDDILPSNDVSDILVEEDTAWITSNVGVYKYVHAQTEQAVSIIPLNITSIRVNDRLFKDFPKELNPTQTKIKVSMVGIYFAGINDIQYRYRLIRGEAKNHWETTNLNSIEFNDLKYGHYTLQIQAFHRKQANIKSLIRTFSFSIKPHYYEKISFWMILFVLLLAVLSLIIYLVFRANKRRAVKTAQLKAKLNEFTLKGLQEQMNPHFIFNSLCTMQHLITTGSEEDVRNYLVDFSALVRNMLEHSRNETHSLQDEITFLKNYVALENIRYKNSFDTEWNIAIDDDEIEEIYIPTMLLQPIIENAIKYGVFNTIGIKGLVQININVRDNDILQIMVTNNGLSSNLQQSKHNSVALKVIQERLLLYRKQNRSGHFELTFTDKTAVATMLIPI